MARCGSYHLPRRWDDWGWFEAQRILETKNPSIQSFIGGRRGYYCPACNTLVVEGTPEWDKVMEFLEEERKQRRVRAVMATMERSAI